MRARVIGTPISVIDLSWSYHYSKATTTRGRMAADDETNQPATIDQAFFKQAKSKRYLAYAILGSLPPLSERQERQRVMSVSSLHDHLSWGFGSNITRGYNSITTSVSKNMEIKNLSGDILSSSGSVPLCKERKKTEYRTFRGQRCIKLTL